MGLTLNSAFFKDLETVATYFRNKTLESRREGPSRLI